MVASDAYDRASVALIKARMNAIYYGRLAKFLDRLDTRLRLLGAFLASGGVVMVDVFVDNKFLTGTIGFLSALVGCVALVPDFKKRTKATAKGAADMAPLYVSVDVLLQRLRTQGDDVAAADVDAQENELGRLRVLESQTVGHPSEFLLRCAEKRAYRELYLDWNHAKKRRRGK